MQSQKKCPACGKWTDGSKKHCAFCGEVIDAVTIAANQRQKREAAAKKKRLENENRFERYLRELEESEKPFHKVLYAILNTLFNIYMAILSFFIWLIALLSG